MSANVLGLQHVSHSYQQGEKTLHILHEVDLELKSGEVVALVGPSGAGKSTLLHIAGLLETSAGGQVSLAGDAAGKATTGKKTKMRRKYLGFVYQFHNLLPEFSALENVMLPQLICGVSKGAAKAKAKSLLEAVGLENRISHRPSQLSGGEQQRVAIARALANDPLVLLADEPTGNLDTGTADQVFSLLMEIIRERGMAALIATHNRDLAARMDRTLTLKDGKLFDGDK